MRLLRSVFLATGLGLALPGVAWAVPTTSVSVNPANTVPGVVANSIVADGQGADWAWSELSVDLVSGSVYNGVPDSNFPQPGFWTIPGFESLEFDTWVGTPGIGDIGTAGGANGLGGGPLSMSQQNISVTWFNNSTQNTSAIPIANISLTDDAIGTWHMIVAFDVTGVTSTLEVSGTVLNGVMVPEPGALVLLGTGGFVLLRREKHN